MPDVYVVLRIVEEVAPEKLEGILHSGFDVNTCDGHGDSVLSHALRVYMTDEYDPDTLACLPRNPQALRQVAILLEHGADVNAPIFKGNTPLHFAVAHSGRKADKPLLKLLLKHGADVTRKNSHKFTPLDLHHGPEVEALIREFEQQAASEPIASRMQPPARNISPAG
ncbi:MAG TPA: hypothetical protein DCW68_04935 [Rhodospirillaceae bacterium]|nr:MAG: hypothetical protein A2018_02710 [Alphaproteobacteria bacterium GWF2_58_20]HAU29441.1 hypothetical protein [Rhodospirillaceae bacterium]